MPKGKRLRQCLPRGRLGARPKGGRHGRTSSFGPLSGRWIAGIFLSRAAVHTPVYDVHTGQRRADVLVRAISPSGGVLGRTFLTSGPMVAPPCAMCTRVCMTRGRMNVSSPRTSIRTSVYDVHKDQQDRARPAGRGRWGLWSVAAVLHLYRWRRWCSLPPSPPDYRPAAIRLLLATLPRLGPICADRAVRPRAL